MSRLRTVALITLVLTTAGFTQGQPQPAGKVQGWQAAPDPSDFKGKLRADVKLTIPVKHSLQVADSTRPGPIVAISDANRFGPRQWGSVNLQTGSYTPAFASDAQFEDPQISPDGALLVGKVTPRQVRTPGLEIWNFKTGKPLHRIAGQDVFTVPQAVGFGANDLLVTLTTKHFDGTLSAVNTKTGQPVWQAKLPAAPEIRNVANSPGGKYVAAVYDKGLWLYDTATGKELSNHPLPEPPEPSTFGSKPLGVAFSNDGAELAAVFEHGHGKSRLIIWDMNTGQAVNDKVVEALRDERWSKRAERKLEYFPGRTLLRYSNVIMDMETGRVIHTIPLNNVEGLKVVGDAQVLLLGERPQNGRVNVAVASLPKERIAKAQDVVRAGGRSSDASLPPLSKPDFSAVRVALDAGAPEPYSLKPDLQTVKTNVGAGPIALRPQRPPSGIEQSAKRIIFSGPPANQMIVAYHTGGAFEKDPAKIKTIIDRINLGAGTPGGTLEIPSHAGVFDFSSDGKLVLVRNGEDRVDLYSMATNPAKHVLGFRPYQDDKNGANVVWAGILSPEQIITVSNAGRIVLWNVRGAKAVYELTIPSSGLNWNGGFTFSPNRKQLAFGNGNGVTILDPATGATLANLKGPKASGDHIAYTFDGSRLAHFTFRPYPHVRAYDLASGRQVGEATLPSHAWTGPVSWAAPNHVLVNGYLADLERKIAVWHYITGGLAPQIEGAPGSRTWAFVSGGANAPSAVAPFTIPHEDAKKLIASIPPDSTIVVRPGIKISVDVSVEGDPEYQKKVAEALKANAAQAGLVVADNQPIRLVATTTSKGSRTIDYEIRGRGVQSATVSDYDCRLQIIKDDITVWEATTSAAGYASFFVHLRGNQTAQDYINSQNKNPGSGFFLTTAIPGTVARPLEKLSTSRFTARGIVNVDPQ